MNFTEFWVNDELRRITLEDDDSPRSMRRWREEWQSLNARPRRPVAAWLGDRLVAMGERLQGWAVATAPRALPE